MDSHALTLDELRADFELRLARPGDAGRIAVLYRQLVGHPSVTVLPERIEALAGDPDTALLVGELGGRVEATALVSLCADVMFGFQPFAVVENLIVDPAQRGQGLGTALLWHIDALCLSRDCSKIMLLSAAHRAGAHRFFERSGYLGTAKKGFVKYRRQFDHGFAGA